MTEPIPPPRMDPELLKAWATITDSRTKRIGVIGTIVVAVLTLIVWAALTLKNGEPPELPPLPPIVVAGTEVSVLEVPENPLRATFTDAASAGAPFLPSMESPPRR